jgi:hypothetical protein
MSDKANFSHYRLAALFGFAGFVLGWLTRPLVEARATALAWHELVAHISGELDPALRQAANQTFLHIGLFGFACALLGYVTARMTQ